MKKKKIITVLIFALIVILAIVFMILGAEEEGKKYSIEEVKEYNYFVLQKDGKYGVIDKQANVLIEPKYESVVIPNPSKSVFVCTIKDNETKIYNEKGEEQFSNYEEVSSIRLKNIASNLMYEKSVLRYKKNGKYGLLDYSGNEITDAIYEELDALEYKEGELLVAKDGKYGVINIKGNVIIPIEYETVDVDEYYSEDNEYKKSGYIVGVKTQDGYRYGYIDVSGNEILKNEYNKLSRITDIKNDNDIFLLASKNGQYGVYKNSDQIINNEYQSIEYNKNNNIFIIEKSKKYGVAGIDGNIIVQTKYSQIDINGKYLYLKEVGGETQVIDPKGNKANISANTSKLSVEDGKYVIVITSDEKQTLYGIEDSNGKQLVKSKYSYIEYLFNNYFMVSDRKGNLGIIDDTGKVIIDLQYSSIQKINNTKLIQASISSEDITVIYSESLEKICEMKSAIVTKTNEYIKI